MESLRPSPIALLLALLVALGGCRTSGCAGQGAESAAWKELQPGLSYRVSERDGARYHLLKVALKSLSLKAIDARVEGRKVAEVEVLGGEAQALAAVNGTFFDDAQRPLGWLVSEGRELNPLRDISWWAAFVVRGPPEQPRADVLTTEQLKALTNEERAQVRLAVQVGPRTVVDGKPLKLKRQVATRTAVCVLRPDEVLILATEDAPVESNQLARSMALAESDGGFGCQQGLMFDGGPSTQLYLRAGGVRTDVRGGWGVPNALAVVPRAIEAER